MYHVIDIRHLADKSVGEALRIFAIENANIGRRVFNPSEMTISFMTEGLTVFNLIGSALESLFVTLSIATRFDTASPGMSDVATDDPGCRTWKAIPGLYLGSMIHNFHDPKPQSLEIQEDSSQVIACFGICVTASKIEP